VPPIYPNIAHTGAGTLKLDGATGSNPIQMLSFSNSSGPLNFNSKYVTTTSGGDFSITNGTNSTISNLGGVTIVVAGNAVLNGTATADANRLRMAANTNWTITVAGTLNASFDTIAHSIVTNPYGYAAPADNGGNNTNWKFAYIWTGTQNSNWSDYRNWSPSVGAPPGAGDIASFESGNVACNLDVNASVKTLSFTSGYTGTFSFGANKLIVSGNATFTSGGDINKGTGTLELNPNSSIVLVPRFNDTLPTVLMNSTGAVTVSTYPLVCNVFRIINSGTFNFGTALSHIIDTLYFSNSGATVNIGSSDIAVSGNANLATIGAVTAGSGVLRFTAATGKTQTLTVDPAKVYFDIEHSGAGTLALGANLQCASFTQNNGILNFNAKNVTTTTGNFSLTNGGAASIANIGGVTITSASDASFAGKAGDSIQLKGSSRWYANVGASHSLTANYAVCSLSTASSATGVASNARNAGGNTNWSFSTTVQPTVRWSRNDLTNVKGAAIGASRIYVAGGNTLYALRLDSGLTAWSYNSGTGACGTPSYDYIGSTYNIVYCQGQTMYRNADVAATTWSQALGANPGTPYVDVSDTAVYVLLDNNTLSMRKFSTGVQNWSANAPNACIKGDIVVMSGYVLAGTTTGIISRFDQGDGTNSQNFTTGCGDSINFPLYATSAAIYAAPAADKLYTRNVTSLATAYWPSPYYVQLSSTITGAPFVDYNAAKIYVAAGSNVVCINDKGPGASGGGEISWTYPAGATVHSGPVPYNGYLYFGRDNGQYFCIYASTQVLGTNWPYVSASGNATCGPWIDITSATKQVIFGTDAGDMHCFATQ
ncbi:MAG: hypothetical protein PHC61_17070, partial [Chitinivibrionales bacterium]|nr:hypothetical protein [Chitinivibrionales bacterium]